MDFQTDDGLVFGERCDRGFRRGGHDGSIIGRKLSQDYGLKFRLNHKEPHHITNPATPTAI